MIRKKIEDRPPFVPSEIESIISGQALYDSSSSPEAKVYFVEKDGGYFIKVSELGALRSEAEMTRYFHNKRIGVEVVEYVSSDCDWLVTKAARGEDCTHLRYLSDPRRLSALLGEMLRALHETEFASCPEKNRTETFSRMVDENYRLRKFDLSLFAGSRFGFSNIDEAYAVFMQGRKYLDSKVLLHGDYCLPNVILDDWRLSSFIDLGNGGVGDRHIDLFWGAWTLWFNLKTNEYTDRFLDAYGRDKIETELLRVVAAAETFG